MLVGLGGGGGCNYLNQKIHQIKFLLLFKRKKNVKYILTSFKKIYIYIAIFFKGI
jgi:hypothetical protein